MKSLFKTRGVFQVILVAPITFMNTPGNLFAQGLPGDQGRWIGTLEGSMVDSQGSGLVYDFQFKEDGTVDVEKSMTVSKLKQPSIGRWRAKTLSSRETLLALSVNCPTEPSPTSMKHGTNSNM